MKNPQELLQSIDELLNTPGASPTSSSVSVDNTQDEATNELLPALQKYFGYTDFRDGQRQVVEKILNGENILAAFPTGYGKSLCYQLPALMLPGITVIVSPLISLMKDQVDALREQKIYAVALLNSSLSWEEYRAELERLERGEIKLLYIAPERFRSRRFLDLLNSHQISLFVIDEAHCISQWGHDFRPSYLALRDAIRELQPSSIALFTATATPDVREDIREQLEIQPPQAFTRGIERPNLKFSVCEASGEAEKYLFLDEHLQQLRGKGIVYAGRRRETEEIASHLKKHGHRVDFYHAGREDFERKRVQERFFDDGPEGLDLVVATNAFGMGIDKSDIRYIIHWTMTGTLEQYYQEAGRAGRDGETAHCILFYCPDDRGLHEWFVKESAPNKPDLLKLLKLIETFPSVGSLRMFAAEELEWLSSFNDSKIRVGISHLEKLGFLRRLYNVPSKLSVRIRPFEYGLTEEIADESQKTLLRHLRAKSELNVLDFCRELNLRPDQLMEQLIDLQSAGYLRYWGAEDLTLIELLEDSDLFASMSADQMGFEDYLRIKNRQIDQIVFYALAEGCRGRLVREYFGEAVAADYRCESCDRCDPSLRLALPNEENDDANTC
ncbi:RecQ family ATP-dependent DNA helicase [Candidatus Poribacteria bacterium]|nr:MAG: RecQ family ATP-dependent DNA helicase [Candidatus Poribacteria bacterium]